MVGSKGTILNVISYEMIFGQDSNPLPTRQRTNALRVMPQSMQYVHKQEEKILIHAI